MFDQFQYRFELSSLKVLIPLLYFTDTFTRTSKSLKNSTQLFYLEKSNKELNSSLFSFSIVSQHLEILLEFFSFLLKKKKKTINYLYIHSNTPPLSPPPKKKKQYRIPERSSNTCRRRKKVEEEETDHGWRSSLRGEVGRCSGVRGAITRECVR